MEQPNSWVKRMVIACALLATSSADYLYGAAGQSPERLFAELAKVKPDQREKRLEEGSRDRKSVV